MSLEGSGQPLGLAQRLDELAFRLDGLRARRSVIALVALLVIAGTAVIVGSSRSSQALPLEDLLPLAGDSQGSSSPGGGPEIGRVSGPSETSVPGETSDGGASSDSTGVSEPAAFPAELADEASGQVLDLVVHVVGAVRTPGIVEVPVGSRVGDVVAAAGGPVEEADIHRLNLAALAVDGMQVRVPLINEDEGPPLIVTPPVTAGSLDTTPSQPVNLNGAGQPELETLPGVGPATATAIISWREENGPFVRLEDLLDVPGIGPAKLAAIADHASV